MSVHLAREQDVCFSCYIVSLRINCYVKITSIEKPDEFSSPGRRAGRRSNSEGDMIFHLACEATVSFSGETFSRRITRCVKSDFHDPESKRGRK